MERPVTTTNYAYLEESVKNYHEAYIVANVTSYPHDIVKRCGSLLWSFIQRYIHKDADFSTLIRSLQLGGEYIIAELEGIHEQLLLAERQLSECQFYTENFTEGVKE